VTKEKILLSHGSGGRMSRELIVQEIVSRFGEGSLRALPDAATLVLEPRSLVFSTDSFVVTPLFFPGGNIGDLAVYGTVNDIAACGGRPLWLALSMILEEGLELETLRQVLDSVRDAAKRCNVAVVTGDTKVVRRGQCDGMYLTSAGIGELIAGFELGENKIQPGDVVLASGTLGDHGMAVMAVREGIQFKDGPVSDTGPVHGLVLSLAELSREVRVMRDPTRGGAASVLNELVFGRKVDILLEEKSLPISGNTHAVAELLGFDLLHVASEGRLIAICGREAAGGIIKKWHALPEGKDAAVIGTVLEGEGRVAINTLVGGKRLVTVPEGELLPRIC
jgi:hydrogenase expression/formation protein HypE